MLQPTNDASVVNFQPSAVQYVQPLTLQPIAPTRPTNPESIRSPTQMTPAAPIFVPVGQQPTVITGPSSKLGPVTVTLNTPLYNNPKEKLVNSQQEADWVNQLLLYLYHQILPLAIPDPVLRSRLVSIESVTTWMAAFTHVSYNPNDGENYEVLEKSGDGAMKLAFMWYLMVNIPNIQEGQLGRLSDFYLQKEFQADLSKKYGLDRLVRTNLDVSIHVKEDVLESLFGALFTVAKLYAPECKTQGPQPISFSPAYDLCYNLLVSIFEDVEIDYRLFLGPPTNQVKEIFEKMKWGDTKNIIKEIETEEQLETGGYRVTLRLTDKFLEYIKNNAPGIQIKSRVFASVTAPTLKVAKKDAYYQGLLFLSSMGISLDWAHAMKKQSPMSDPFLAAYYPAAKAQSEKEGLVDIIFSKGKEGSQVIFTQLIGIDANHRKYILATIDGTPRSRRDQRPTKSLMKQAALKQYARQGVNPNSVSYFDI